MKKKAFCLNQSYSKDDVSIHCGENMQDSNHLRRSRSYSGQYLCNVRGTRSTLPFGNLCIQIRCADRIASKIILRHSNLSTTKRYLGTISDMETIDQMDREYKLIEAKG